MDKKELAEGRHMIKGLKGLEKVHPHQLLTYFLLFGLSLVYSYLLITLTIETFITNTERADIQFPKFYIVASFLILVSLYIPTGLIRAFKEENLFLIRKKIFGLFLMGAVFLIFQGIGWFEVSLQGISLKSNYIGTYLYIISGLHMVSVLFGLGPMAYYLYLSRHINSDGVARLIYFTSPYEKTKLDIMRNYWIYVCFSWIFVVTWLIFLV